MLIDPSFLAQDSALPDRRDVLAGGGEAGTLMRSMDWSQSPLGPVENWSQGLKTAVRIMLTSRYAMWLGWGDPLVFLYNDSYAKMTLGKKHPWALGKPAHIVWAEIWDDIYPRIERVMESGEATWDEALLLFLERNGYAEETYHTFSYSPLSDDTGEIAGMLCVVTEETERVIGERRLGVLREVGIALATASTPQEVFATVGQCIGHQPQDLPFTLTYLFEANGQTAQLITTTGIPTGHEIAIPTIHSQDSEVPWQVTHLQEQLTPILVEDLANRFRDIPTGPWDKSPTQAIVLPLARQGQERVAGFIVAGLNPYRPFDSEYSGFMRLLTNQVAASLANAQAYEQERKRATALAELDRAKTAFFSNVSHEFRTPLTLMLGPIEDALADSSTTLPPVQRERLEIAHRNTMRLLKLANNLLDFTRIEAGRMNASFQPTDLSLLTVDLASSFRSAMERAGLEYSVNCLSLPQPVYVDQDMWEKIVLNLLSNAFKYTLSGRVDVSLRPLANHVEFTVQDTGIGIPEADLPRVFERFHRVEGAKGRTHEGTGIGLALVQELVKLQGGEVSVKSAYGEGTTFTVLLPFGISHLSLEQIGGSGTQTSTSLSADAYATEALRLLPEQEISVWDGDPDNRSAPQNADTSNLSRVDLEKSSSSGLERIVVADDNADMRTYIARLLREWYDVEVVTNGREALEAVQRNRPDLVLSDVMMPEMDGFELLAALRSHPDTATIPIILLSARAGEDARVEGIHAGADDYLIKPFSKRELQVRVSSLLQLVRLRRQATEVAERFRAAFEHAAVGLLITDTEGKLLEVNPAFCQITGYEESELLTLDLQTITHPDDWEESLRLQKQLLQEDISSFLIEKRYLRKDGGTVWVQNSVAIVRDEHGHPHRIIALSEDVSERVHVQQERERLIGTLVRERARLIELFMQAPAFISVVRGPEHVFELVNPPYLQMVGHRDILGKPVRSAFPEVEGQGIFEILDTVYRTGEPFVGRNMRVNLQREANGPLEERYLDLVIQAQYDEAGNVIGIFTHGVDLTYRKQAEDEREQLLTREQSARSALETQQAQQAVTLRYLRAANRSSKQMTKAATEEAIVTILNETLHNDLNARFSGIWLASANKRKLILTSEIGLKSAPTRSLEPEIDVMLNAYIIGWVARFNRPLISNNLSNDLHFDTEWLKEHGIISAVVLPLSFQDQLLGVVATFFPAELPIEMSDVLATLASVAAASLHNRRTKATQEQDKVL